VGFLYTMQEHGLELAAQRSDRVPAAGLDAFMAAFVSQAILDNDEVTRTATSVDPPREFPLPADESDRWCPLLLGHDTPRGHAVTGAAVVRVEDTSTWDPPYTLLLALSRSLTESGDVATVMISA
jgi:hypothetical protein